MKNEEARNRWISEHSSDSVHNKLHSLTVQLELEKEMATWTGKMKRFIQEGKAPNDTNVLAHIEELVSVMKPKVEPLLDDVARKQLENNEGSFEEPNPYLFPSAFNKEEEMFIGKAMDELIRSKVYLNQQDNSN
ncbi:hypothetical protein NiCM35_07785 [Niallia circulans]|uniref:hypothetical protein n=1 Tax=Niallia circulans TaxID=1397 RepID=UPI003D9564C9